MMACIIGISGQEDTTRYRASVVHHADLPQTNLATSTRWSDHNADLSNTRYSPLDQITVANAGALVLKRSYEVPTSESIREETPLVVDA